MLSKKDKAIKENIEKDHTLETFYNQVLIDNDNIDDEFDCDVCYEAELHRTCHIWQGNKDKSGYGNFTVYSKEFNNRISVKAHRFAYAAEYGFDALPAGFENNSQELVLNHRCHNRACVNTWHLELITGKENISPVKRKSKVTQNG